MRETGDGAYTVVARFNAPEAASVAREVLIDYPNIPRFMLDVRTSQ